MRVLITSGGTKIPIDRVRSITNMSKGTFGAQIAEAFAEDRSHVDIDFVMAKGSKSIIGGTFNNTVSTFEYETFSEYQNLLFGRLVLKPDIVILAAAVSDYEVENVVDGKIRTSEDLLIRLKPLPKLIGRVKELCPDAVLCGFKLLVGSTSKELIDAAQKSIYDNMCNLVIANDLSTIKDTKNHSMIVVKSGWHKEFFRKDFYLPDIVKHFCMEEFLKR